MTLRFSLMAGLALILTAAPALAQESDRAATPAEAAVIDGYRTAINTAFDRVAATGGWSERTPNHFDIPADVQVLGWTRGPFTFEGDISRLYEHATAPGPDRSEQIQAIMQKRAKSKSATERAALMKQMQDLAMAPVDTGAVSNLFISSSHNQGYYIPDSEKATKVAAPPPGVALMFTEPPTQVTGADVTYVLEFCDPSRFVYDPALQAYPYKYAHNDGSPHIEEIEIRLEGPKATLDAALAAVDWTKVAARLNP